MGKPSREAVSCTVARELISKFPDAPALTLAKRLFREHPELWTSLDSCRSTVRYILGVKGKFDRKNIADKSLHREPRKAGNWLDVIPESLAEAWPPVIFNGPLRVLVLCDPHIPYQENEPVRLALDYGLEHDADMVLLNGDIVDCYQLSRWERDPRKRNFPAEVRAARQFLKGLRREYPKARICWKMGNHEERYEKYLRLKAPELLGLEDFEWENVFEFEEHKIEMVKDQKRIKLGKLTVIHGHENARGISNPVNPARGYFLKNKAHVLGGHFHQSSHHTERTIDDLLISSWSVGCLCDLHPEYARLNNWSHGFAFVIVDKDGAFQVENKRILDGKIW